MLHVSSPLMYWTRPRCWHAITSVVSAVLVAATIAACGGTNTARTATPSGGADAGAFPVTIAHKYGSTEITAEPQRVVTVGLTEQDALIALGKVPVGATKWLGEYDGAVMPWAEDELNGAPRPKLLTDDDGIQFEKIAELRPDLIMGLYSDMTQADYDTLSQIAPTVAQPGEHTDFGIPWQKETRTIGKAIGKPAKAEQLVAETEPRIAEAKASHPEFAGQTAAMATPFEGIFVYGTQDPRSRLLTDLNFSVPAEIDSLSNSFGGQLSRERLDLLDVGVLVWILPEGQEAALRADPLYATMEVSSEGRDIFVNENTVVGHALSFVSPLSLPFLLDNMVPRIAAAADGNPATTTAG